jgi:hypothetical protein
MPRSGGNDACRHTQAFRVSPGDLPEFLRRTPDGAEPLGALAQIELAVSDANRDDVVIPLAGISDKTPRS